MNNEVFLGIDTSNYTTSLAVSENNKITRNIRKLLSVKSGERGLRQSDAVFLHTVNLPELFKELGKISPEAIGVSLKPRDVQGSYMPCFLSGVAAATAIAETHGIPLYTFSHQAGHIAAALYSCGREDLHKKSFLAFHVSGGTTELVLFENGNITLLGGTKDISAGKLIDRTGVMLGLDFPCGNKLEELISRDGIDISKVKAGHPSVDDLSCNFSGIENKVKKLISDGVKASDIGAYVISVVTETLSVITENAKLRYSGIPVLYAGGVMSNKYIKNTLEKRFDGIFAQPEFSSDNASGIARLTELKYNGLLP